MEICPSCGRPIDDAARAVGVCSSCGTSLNEEPAAAATIPLAEVLPHVDVAPMSSADAAPLPESSPSTGEEVARAVELGTQRPPTRVPPQPPISPHRDDYAQTVPLSDLPHDASRFADLRSDPSMGAVLPQEKWGPTIPLESRLSPEQRIDIALARPSTQYLKRDSYVTKPPSKVTIVGLIVGIGALVMLVMACTLTFASAAFSSTATKPHLATPTTAKTSAPLATPTNIGLGFPTQVSDPTPLPYTQATPTLEPTETPYGGIPTATPLPPSATNSPGNGQPTPSGPSQTASFTIANVKCNHTATQATFDLTTNSPDQIPWQAAVQPGTVAPNAGTLAAGQSVGLKVDNFSHVFTIVISGGQNTQPFTVTCQ